MIVLGGTYTDKISGFKGVATGRCEYITGCNQVLLQPKSGKGEKAEAAWFDEQRLVVDGKAKLVTLDNGNTPGFCEAAPIR